MDYYENMDAIRQTFIRFINKVPFYGTSIICLDNDEIQGILPQLKKKYLTYGMTSQADLKARSLKKEKLRVSFEVLYRNHSFGRLELGMSGDHNVLNALAAIGVALELDVPVAMIKKGLRNLGGLARRFQVKGEYRDVVVLDDYGHHPAEIVTTLKTAKECWPQRRLVVVFQPHRYTRTEALYDRFFMSFNDADVLIVTPIFSAGENPIEGVSAERLDQGIRKHGHKEVILCTEEKDILPVLLSTVKPGDLVMTLGAGSIYQIGERLLKAIRERD
jgi:UDP-N-acetylmuramate--alanine ligase